MNKDNTAACPGNIRAIRDSRIELLRIIVMLLIVAHHYGWHGCEGRYLSYSTNKILIDAISCFGKVGVNVFILISGYFMVKTTISIKKLLLLWGEVLFYPVIRRILELLCESLVKYIKNGYFNFNISNIVCFV